MRVAYIINQYPKVSHSFIRREILALESIGCSVLRIAIRGWDEKLVDPSDKVERDKTRYILQAGIGNFVLSFVRVSIEHPVRVARACALAWKVARQGRRSVALHIIYLAEACRILPWLVEYRVRHLHAHFGTNSAEIAMLVHVLGGPTWSFTVHGPEEFDRNFEIALSEKLKRCAFVVAVSSYGRAQLQRMLDFQLWSKVRVVHCGLDLKFFAEPRRSTVAKNRFVCVGRFCEQKGQLLLLEACRRLIEEGVDFELVLAGDGPMRHELELCVVRFGLQKLVRITGWLSEAEVKEELASARALVLPSFAEGLPVVIMEAMALECPTISTFVAGIPELVQPDNGWLVPAGSVSALMAAMRACLEISDAKLMDMGKRARARVKMRHDIELTAERLLKMFRS